MPNTSMPTSSGWRPRLKTNDRSTSPGFDERLRVGGDGEDAEEQHRGADDLGDQVGAGVADRRAGGRTPRASRPGRRSRPSAAGTPATPGRRRANAPIICARDVARHVGPREAADRGQRDGHGGIEVRAADAPDGVDGDRDGDAPPGGDDDPAGVVALGPVAGRRWRRRRRREGRGSSCRRLPRRLTAWSGSIARRAMPRTSHRASQV